MPAKKHYLIKIFSINTYQASYFDDYHFSESFEKASRRLQDEAFCAPSDFADCYFAMHKAMLELAKVEFDAQKMRAHDMVQTTLFVTNNKVEEENIRLMMTVEDRTDNFAHYIDSWCDNLNVFIKDVQNLEQTMINEAKRRNGDIEKARKHVRDHKLRALKQWVYITTNNFQLRTALTRIDTRIYYHWLFISKQLLSLKSSDQTHSEHFEPRFLALKESIMALGQSVRASLTELGDGIYPHCAQTYVTRLFSYHFDMLKGVEKFEAEASKETFELNCREQQERLNDYTTSFKSLSQSIKALAKLVFSQINNAKVDNETDEPMPRAAK